MNLTTIANAAATATNAADAGVVVTVDHNCKDPEFVIWAIGTNGQITEHRLDTGSTDLARLTAHVAGFITNHQRAWAAA